MRICFAARAALLALAFGCVSGPAMAQQRAPIVFAGQGGTVPAPREVMTASVAPGLAGGDDNSYGYGAPPRARAGAVIDIRRAPGAAPQPVQAQESAAEAPAEQGAQPWLERERVGPPYEANGRWYVPTAEPGYAQTGMASWYGPQFHGQPTASGELFDQEALTAAHPTLPIPSLVQVTNLENGREIIVRVNDRGPFVGERLIDLSRRSAEVLGFEAQGQARVHVRYLGPAPRHVNGDGSAAPALAAAHAAQAPVASPPLGAFAQNDGPASLLPPAPARRELAEWPVASPAPFDAGPAQNAGYFVQVGAFSDLSNAHRVRASVADAGPVSVDTRQSASGELFRVRLGPYVNREDAETARLTLADLGYGEAILAAR